ncbi:MarR family transcriptional regulator [Kribbella sandramycini]|uniref:MarR family transcriptional regulator n=1 Tax=Kribbella sandramycini TaxID=60450 RepID=A0A7Y4L4D1_9ACTN|nr:MarR family transcriptional regulator [Kribbella sandramycini]MBB6571511.1 DNA-binding MarR family transcriptional regulator [Kribbella sandramycini]NOL44160.1 MarR family transcriptional regulator [Kribbella sandramycini]
MQVNDAYTPQTPIEGVMHAFTRVGRRLKAKQPGDTMDHSAHIALFVLRCSGALRLSELAARMELDASTTSRQVRALERLGMVRRSPDPDDGRAFRVELTEQGIAQWEANAQRRVELLTAALDGWSEADIETFERLMTRFADAVTASTEAPPHAAWADKGWAAMQAARRSQDSAPDARSTSAAREHIEQKLESTT